MNSYNEINIPSCAVYNDTEIRGFFSEYMYLSNFWSANIWFEGRFYTCAENAYQAAKVRPEYREHFNVIKPGQSKKEWKNYPRIDINKESWDARKYDVMSAIVFDKFYRNIELREKLLATENKYLEETNFWRDTYWGVYEGSGDNNLGKILMNIRKFWQLKNIVCIRPLEDKR